MGPIMAGIAHISEKGPLQAAYGGKALYEEKAPYGGKAPYGRKAPYGGKVYRERPQGPLWGGRHGRV